MKKDVAVEDPSTTTTTTLAQNTESVPDDETPEETGFVDDTLPEPSNEWKQNVSVEFPKGRVILVKDFSCESNFFRNSKAPPDIVIRAAKDLGLCHKLHYSIATSTPSEAVKSIIAAYNKDKAIAKTGQSYSFEIDDLLKTYAYLISAKEAAALEKIAKQKKPDSEIASTILRIYKESLKPQ